MVQLPYRRHKISRNAIAGFCYDSTDAHILSLSDKSLTVVRREHYYSRMGSTRSDFPCHLKSIQARRRLNQEPRCQDSASAPYRVRHHRFLPHRKTLIQHALQCRIEPLGGWLRCRQRQEHRITALLATPQMRLPCIHSREALARNQEPPEYSLGEEFQETVVRGTLTLQAGSHRKNSSITGGPALRNTRLRPCPRPLREPGTSQRHCGKRS